jgi:acyl-coenzyme A synthetase/AMP-(fatty) acid ligase
MVLSAQGSTSYAAALELSMRLAAGLPRSSLRRIGCLVTDQATLISLLAAASATGCETCTYPPGLPEAGVDELAGALHHTVVVTDRNVELTAAMPLSVADLSTPGGSGAGVAGGGGDDGGAAPLLVLTTGTTGRPKAARHDWSRLVAAARRHATQPGERWLLAYNLNQFGGLQVMLHALVSGASLVVPRSNQPRDALDAMLRHGVTHASATPTFWRFIVALLDGGAVEGLQLRQITLGGEAAPLRLLDDLRRLFPDVRISHVYASTEFGSSVSVADGRQGLPLGALERSADGEVQLRIVDGQLEARSSVGMFGYYGDPDVGTDEWRPTGDLVEVQGDRIHFVGRATDTINVGGVKVHPLPIEEAVSAVDGVQLARVYGRPNAIAGQIVAVDVVAAPAYDADALEDAIRWACRSFPPAAQPRRVRFVDAVGLREQKIARGEIASGEIGRP